MGGGCVSMNAVKGVMRGLVLVRTFWGVFAPTRTSPSVYGQETALAFSCSIRILSDRLCLCVDMLLPLLFSRGCNWPLSAA